MRKLTNALLLIAVGAAIFFLLPTIKRWAAGPPPRQLIDAPLAAVEVEGATGDATGNVVINNCLAALDRRTSISVDVLQSGAIGDQIVETHGVYLQQGQNDSRRFSLLLQGRVGASPARVWQVSDGRFLYTDVAWDGVQAGGRAAPGRRSVKRIDLRVVRKRLDESRGVGRTLAPGSATADLAPPGFWAGLGGLPMLVDALADSFDFGAPRQMYLRNEPVYAMIGRWKTTRRDGLLTPATPTDGDAAEPVAMPPRLPDHVLLAIGARDLFPHLIEYRGKDDELSAPGIAEDVRFHESRAPLLRMDFLKPQFDRVIEEHRFVYREPEGVDLSDRTNERLAQIDRDTQRAKLARQPAGPLQ